MMLLGRSPLFAISFVFIIPLCLQWLLLSPVIAASGPSPGVKVDAAIGSPSIALTNPDDSIAYYGGISLRGEVEVPIYVNGAFSSDLSFLGRYFDLTNTANSSVQREMANHIGPGLGLRLSYSKLYAGMSLYYMRARHIWVGSNNYYQEYDYTASTTYFGLSWNPANLVSLSLSYETGQATISSSQINLTRDVPYSESTVWLHLTYTTGSSLQGLIESLLSPK